MEKGSEEEEEEEGRVSMWPKGASGGGREGSIPFFLHAPDDVGDDGGGGDDGHDDEKEEERWRSFCRIFVNIRCTAVAPQV